MGTTTEAARDASDARARLRATAVVVLHGGTSGEREVSLQSGRAIVAALAEPAGSPGDDGGPAAVIPVEVSADGRWLVEGRPLEARAALDALPPDALFFLGLHGGAGEDGTLQGFLTVAGRAHTGSGVAASALCMDKHRARLVFQGAGLATAPGVFVERGPAPVAEAVERDLARLPGPPWFVKPNRGGSSVQVTRVAAGAELAPSVQAVLGGGDDALVESAVAGLEVTCGVVGNRRGSLRALPVVEILPNDGRFFDYGEKYSPDGAREVCPPRLLAPAAVERVQERALRAYRAAGCDGYARVDFIVPEGAGTDAGGEPVVLELNTLPGFTARSLLPRAAAAAGQSFRELCLELCALALES